jgi:hypothetical protein
LAPPTTSARTVRASLTLAHRSSTPKVRTSQRPSFGGNLRSNRSYAILNIEMARAGFDTPGPLARSLFDLGRPCLDWVKLAEGIGVEATRVESVGAFADQFASALRTTGPRLIEAVI